MTETVSGEAKRTSRNSWVLKASVAGVAMALALLNGCAGRQDISTTRTGDEPPIRVRNGSLEIELLPLAGQSEFEEVPQSPAGRVWQVKDRERRRNDFLVVIVSSSPDCNGIARAGNKVDVTYSDGQSVDFQFNNTKSKVTANRDALTKVSNQLLRHGTPNEQPPPGQEPGHITGIKITGPGGGQTTCTFGGRDANLQMFIVD